MRFSVNNDKILDTIETWSCVNLRESQCKYFPCFLFGKPKHQRVKMNKLEGSFAWPKNVNGLTEFFSFVLTPFMNFVSFSFSVYINPFLNETDKCKFRKFNRMVK